MINQLTTLCPLTTRRGIEGDRRTRLTDEMESIKDEINDQLLWPMKADGGDDRYYPRSEE
jgi:hypothetical protein